MPVTVQNMNYTRVVVGGLLILILCWWFVGSKQYKDKIAAAKVQRGVNASPNCTRVK
jgi:choline transport protein